MFIIGAASMTTLTSEKRYVDRGMLTARFGANAICVCPNCGGPARVQSHSEFAVPFRPQDPRVTCTKCSLALLPDQWKWFGPVVGTARRPCGNCGFKWLKCKVHRRAGDQKLSSTHSVVCEACGERTSLPLKWAFVRLGLPHDPVFGLPLWFQISCLGETLWAYNREHLAR